MGLGGWLLLRTDNRITRSSSISSPSGDRVLLRRRGNSGFSGFVPHNRRQCIVLRTDNRITRSSSISSPSGGQVLLRRRRNSVSSPTIDATSIGPLLVLANTASRWFCREAMMLLGLRWGVGRPRWYMVADPTHTADVLLDLLYVRVRSFHLKLPVPTSYSY